MGAGMLMQLDESVTSAQASQQHSLVHTLTVGNAAKGACETVACAPFTFSLANLGVAGHEMWPSH